VKAFVLAAGLGTRLRPITDHTPKCMLEVGGELMLDRWIDALGRAGIDEVLINLHHLPEVVRSHVADRESLPTVRTVCEPTLLGSAGTLRANRDWIAPDRTFLVCNVDNLTDFDLSLLVSRHRNSGTMATLAVFRAENPSACGIVDVDDTGRMVGFEEKPAQPRSDLANAGMYAFDVSVLEAIVGANPIDIGHHLLPALVGKAQTVLVEGYFRDIGTPAALQMAQDEWAMRSDR
jgi:mannose-1-phosphate guanylyltransferase